MPDLSYWTAQAVSLVLGGAITACTMYLFGWRRVRRGGTTRLVVGIDRTPLRQRVRCVSRRWRALRAWFGRVDRLTATGVVLVVAMAAALFYGQVQAALFYAHQRECNAEFRSTSLELRRIGNEDRALENQDDALRDRRDTLQSALIKALATPAPPGERWIDPRAVMADYNTAVADLDVQRARLVTERADLERQRRAQPTPPARC